MKKSKELYVKHLYSSGTDHDEDYGNKKQSEVIINEVNYREKRDFRRHEKLNYQSGPGQQDGWGNNYSKTHQTKEPSNGKNSKNHFLCKPAAKSATSNGQSQTTVKEEVII